MITYEKCIPAHADQRLATPSASTTLRTVIQDIKPLVRMGASVILLHPRSKRPVGNGWTDDPVATVPDIEATFEPGMNVGIRLGKWSKIDGLYLHVLDVDIRDPDVADEAFDRLESLFEGYDVWSWPCVKSGSGGKSRHFYFLTDSPFPSKKLAHSGEKFTDDAGKKHWTWEHELFGTGKQVALPPSIHPSGKAYRWEVEFDPTGELPYVPESFIETLVYPEEDDEVVETEVLEMTPAEAEEAIKHLDLDYWCEDREGWRNLGMALHHEFGGSEAGYEIWCAFSKQSRKYDPKIQRQQWKSFKDRTDKPVTMRSIVKAANEAVREAEFRALPGEFEDLPDEEEDRESEEDRLRALIDEFEDLEPTTDEPDADEIGVPAHLRSVPGVLQKLVDHYNATAVRPQEQFAVQAALAFGSVVLGRYWRTDEDNYTSLYFLNVAPTASGKEHAKKVIERALEESGLAPLIGPKGYTSEAGVLSALVSKPKHISIMDEFGRYLASSRTSGNSHKQDAQSAFMETFGRLDGTYRSIGYSTQGMTKEQIEATEKREVKRPALTILGMTTPATLFEALGGIDVKDGFLNRFLIVQSPNGRQKRRRGVGSKEIPHEVLKWAKEHAYKHGGSDEDDNRTLIDTAFVPEPVLVPFTSDALDMLDRIEDEVLREMDRMDQFGMAELFGRTQEIAQRLALIVARSERSDKVRAGHLQWAWDYVRYYHREMAMLFKDNIGKSEHEAIAEDVLTFLKKRGSEGAGEREITQHCRAFRALDRRGRDEILIRVQSDHGVKHVTSENARGPKTKRYFAPKR